LPICATVREHGHSRATRTSCVRLISRHSFDYHR
jgi:hypothetical protein